MKTYLVNITFIDGSRCRMAGLYAHGCDAVSSALDLFINIKRISARRLS